MGTVWSGYQGVATTKLNIKVKVSSQMCELNLTAT